MRRILLVLALILFLWGSSIVPSAVAQTERFGSSGEGEEERELETDRDAFTPATSTAGKWLTIVESSYSFIDNRSVAETHSFPELLARFGVSERIELRLGWNYEVGGTGDVVSGNEGGEASAGGGLERESQILYGFKAAISEQDGWVPRSAAILQGFTPTSGEAPATDVVVTYAFGWELANRWRLDSSMRYGTEHGPGDAFNQWAPSVVLRVPITERWQGPRRVFWHLFGRRRTRCQPGVLQPRHALSASRRTSNLASAWAGALPNDAPNFFSNVGIGWRF